MSACAFEPTKDGKKARCKQCGLIVPLRCPIAELSNPNCGIQHEIAAKRARGPGIVRKAFNFAGALAAHVADGMDKRTVEEIQEILSTHCKVCPLFSGSHCTHKKCGCNISREKKFFNALAWRSKHCPIDKW